MKTKLRKAASLSIADWWVLVRAWGLLLLVDLALRVLPFTRLQDLLKPNRAHCSQETGSQVIRMRAERVVRLVGIAARYHLCSFRCLHRALVARWILGREGILVDLRIGVRREARRLKAHAWLEYDGQVLGPAGEVVGFTPLAQMSTLVRATR